MVESPGAAALEGQGVPVSSWWERAMRWRQTSHKEAVSAEGGLLALIRSKVLVRDVPTGPAPDQFMHTLEAGSSDASSPPVVMLPGYGAGVGMYFRNVDGLAPHMKLYMVDWLGTGLSGRPPFMATTRQQAEDFFLDAFETWRQQQPALQQRKAVLVGHSLGGYLAATYALRHPENVAHLVLVCPAGIPQKPDGWDEQRMGSLNAWSLRTQLLRTARNAWEAGVTPGSVVRSIGPWGPNLINKYVLNRFHSQGVVPLNAAEAGTLSSYLYHILAARGSGEFALRHLLAPGAWAHEPLATRLEQLKVPVTWIYGEHDWMDPAAAVRVARRLDTIRAKSCASDHAVELVPNSGHYVHIEQPALFNEALLRALAPHFKGVVGAGGNSATGVVLDAQGDGETASHVKMYNMGEPGSEPPRDRPGKVH